ncbi:hypothetical protein KSH05_000933 [Salmonella enterica subsp. enterica serovar Anatum]|uniref:Uncharacterized protein n=1 Tax=Salmonella anatum TaxID=58712 RepID=A0A4Z9PH86_SALAN|nr:MULTISPECIES: hypothetical protein [Enterobacteriaceae]EDL5265234.1 hypothetical protein [Salmonella enterica subsp. enterica serovar Enteritidis]EJU8721697.1 hypothetical protein [Salmonella enterica subsp. enterica]MBW6637294.1 hypothetical protein [Salmonella enterica subsp. enterica serovar Weltevreden]HCM6296326.1 hypothetical protein [Salmonella enterica subsp. enterica serovar 3:e,h:1,6]AMY87458.1 hypothetical protein AW58_06910 [Salmonella enterica subsp. enterica serovar Anatum str
MKIVINILFLFISAHVIVYFVAGKNDVISNLIAAIEMVSIMAFIYSKTKIKPETEEKQSNSKLQKRCE